MKINNPEDKLLVYKFFVDLIIFALLSIAFIFNMPGIPLGYLLGAVISTLTHFILRFQINCIIKEDGSVGNAGLFLLFYFIRFALYGVGLFIAFFLDYKGYKYFAWYTVFIAYLVIKVIIYAKFSDITSSKLFKPSKLNDFSQFDKKD